MRTFEDVIQGRTPSHRVWEDEHHLAILAPAPIRPGHVILITKRTVGYVFDLPPSEHAALWEAARRVAVLLKRALECERVCTAVIGWEVRHVHVHLVPTRRAGEFPPLGGAAASESELAEVARRIREAVGASAE